MKIKNLAMAASIILLMLLARVLMGSYTEHRKGIELMEEKPREAVYAFAQSIRWYLPLNPWVNASIEELKGISEKHRKRSPELGLLALSEIRHALYSVRSFYQPYENELETINTSIANQRFELDCGETANDSCSRSEYLSMYQVRDMPFPYALFCFHLFFWTWLFNLIWIAREVGATLSRFKSFRGRMHLLYVCVGFLCWAYFLSKVEIA